jgi:cytochrome c biogenesis protein
MALLAAARRWAVQQEWNPLRALFRLFTSVRFAIVMVLVAALAALLGVIFPQAPDPVRLNPAAYDVWMEQQRARYGIFAEWLRHAGLFEVFHTYWFNAIFFVLLAAVAVCTANRFAPTWRMVRRPQKLVSDRFLERAHAHAAADGLGDPAAVERVLRAHRYRVERVAERDGAVYLFADRYPWAALATFVTHLSLILFMAGGIVSKLTGFSAFLEVGEGSWQPVFPVLHPNQLLVENLASIEGRDAQGNVIDYRTRLVIYRNGREICRGETTVNDPLRCAGYRFHQASYSGDGVALRVRDVRTGALVYSEVPLLSRQPAAPSPRLVVRDANGTVLFDDYLVLRPLDDRRSIALVPIEAVQRVVPVVLFRSQDTDPWQLGVIYLRDKNNPSDQDAQVVLRQGESGNAGGLTFTYADLRGLPSLIVQGIPGIAPVALLQLVNERDGSLILDVQNVAHPEADTAHLELRPGQPVRAGDYEYLFDGRRAYSGIEVRRDPGAWLIWVATALLLGGLLVTFYVPRRRLWLKVTPERTLAAGIAERTAPLSAELQRLLDEARGHAGRAERSPAPAHRL